MKELTVDFSATQRFEEIGYESKLIVRRAIERTLRHESFPYPVRVSVTFCDNAYIHRLNRTYRGVDRPTDVLSFPLYEDGHFDEAECRLCAELGDIVLSVERIREQAAELGHSFLRECAFLTVHSTLHLLGYDHERSAEDDEAQCQRQQEIFADWEIEV